MKAILEFNLPEEEDIHLMSLKGPKLASALDAFDHWLRNKMKHENLKTIKIQEVRDTLRNCCDE